MRCYKDFDLLNGVISGQTAEKDGAKMNISLTRWGTALVASLAIAGCGGGGGGGGTVVTPPATGTTVAAAVAAAAADPSNDTSKNTSSAFTVVQTAGVPAVTINSPPVVNFTVFSDGGVVTGLKLSNVKVAMAKLVPATDGNPDQWVSYVNRIKTPVVTASAPSVKASALQATTDPTSSATSGASSYPVDCITSGLATLTENAAEGYYTYKFCTDVTKTKDQFGNLVFDPTKTTTTTNRVVLQLSYKNKAGVTVSANPYFDFTLNADGTSVAVDATKTRKMADVASCNSCHDRLAAHGSRIDTQYCVVCHNPGTTDPVSGNVVTLSTMIHKIHAGKRLASAEFNDPFFIGAAAPGGSHDFSEVGFPQDLRNCTKCHSGAGDVTPQGGVATPQGGNWKTVVSREACLTCHSSKAGGAWDVGHTDIAKTLISSTATAATLTNKQCMDCHLATGSQITPERVHWNQNEENAAKYKMVIVSADYTADTSTPPTKKGTVLVTYKLVDPTNGDAAYDLSDPMFAKLAFNIAYMNMDGLNSQVTEFTNYNNNDSGSIVAKNGTKGAGNVYTQAIDVKSLTARGTGRIVSIGQVLEPALDVKTRVPAVPAATVNTVVQNTYADFVISGTTVMPARRAVVSSAKCNACHGALGTTSGANELTNAFHSGARNTVEACVICHDSNRASSGNMMADGSSFYEAYQFKRMIHGIHGNSQRTYPFTHGNKVVGKFTKAGVLTGTTAGSVFADVSFRSPTVVVPRTAIFSDAALPAVIALGTSFAAIDTIINNVATAAPYSYTGTSLQATENYAAEVAYPQQGSTVAFNCNACHVNDSYKTDQSNLGTVVMKPLATGSTTTLETDATKWLVISPKASSCTTCHDGLTKTSKIPVAQHIADSAAKGSFGTLTQAGLRGVPSEGCSDCHAPGALKGVDIVHGQK